MQALKNWSGLTRGMVISKNANLTWTHNMHWCAEIFYGMFELTGNVNKTCEQQCELETVRITNDMKDL